MPEIDFTKSLWWLWIPLAVSLIQIILESTLSHAHLAMMLSEHGPHEAIQFIIIAAAFFVALGTLIKMPKDNKWLVAWIAIAALCSLYVAGEELSWGQWVFKWGTPEFWSGINDQNETNLHNTSSWLDQKPRLILLIGILTGGIVIPALKKFKPALLPSRFIVIYPPSRLAALAILLVILVIIKMIQKFTGLNILERSSEIEELFMFYFVLLYLIDLRHRLLAKI